MPPDTVFELRDYTLHPGQRDVLIALFERHFIESQDALGAHVRATFRDADRPDHFVWIRSFADMPSRRAALEGFYSGPVWQAHREAANATMLDSDDVHLLQPVAGGPAWPERVDGGRVAVEVFPGIPEAQVQACIRGQPDVLAAFRTEPSKNDFPQLPVHGHEVVVLLRRMSEGSRPARLEGLPPPAYTLRLMPTERSPLQ